MAFMFENTFFLPNFFPSSASLHIFPAPFLMGIRLWLSAGAEGAKQGVLTDEDGGVSSGQTLESHIGHSLESGIHLKGSGEGSCRTNPKWSYVLLRCGKWTRRSQG